MAKSTKPRWRSNEEEGEALIQAFSSGAFDIVNIIIAPANWPATPIQ